LSSTLNSDVALLLRAPVVASLQELAALRP
jgi:hypothetical protein